MPYVGIYLILFYTALLIVGATGYVLNIIAFLNAISGDITAMFVARIAGMLIPALGAVLGFF